MGRHAPQRSAFALGALLIVGHAAAANAEASAHGDSAERPVQTPAAQTASDAQAPTETRGAEMRGHGGSAEQPVQTPAGETVRDGACPAAQSIERRLAALRTPAAEPLWYRVDVHRDGDALTVRAVTASGETWLERNLPGAAPCEELEQAAAVVLFAWEAQLPPGTVPAPQLEEHEAAPVRAEAPRPERLRVSAKGAAWLSALAPTGGGAASVDFRPTRLPLALSLDVFGQGQRTLMLGGGNGTWSRLSFALGLNGTLKLDERVSLTLGLAGVTGLFSVYGSGYTTSHQLYDWDAGLLARVELLLPGLWNIRPFVGADGVVWLREHTLVSTGFARTQQALPNVEVAPCAGLAWTL